MPCSRMFIGVNGHGVINRKTGRGGEEKGEQNAMLEKPIPVNFSDKFVKTSTTKSGTYIRAR